MLSVGAAAVEITPPVGTRLVGQFADRIMEDVHDPLSARALVLDNGETKVALVSCDLLSLKRPTVLAARSLAGQLTGIDPRNILICATHTHGGPQVVDVFTRPPDHDYLALLPRQIASAIALADRRRVAARIGIASGAEDRTSHNRRFLTAEGQVRMHATTDMANIVGPEGPADPEVGVLWACSSDGHVVAALVNHTAHPTAVGHELAATADYPGALVRVMERALGEGSVPLFINGAFGNVGPIGRYSPDHREYGYHWAERTGTLVAAEALKVIASEPVSDAIRLAVASETVHLAVRPVTPEQLTWARQGMENACGSLVDRIYAGELLLLAEERDRDPTVTAEVQVVIIGDAALVCIPAELFVEFGLEIKQQSPFHPTYIAGMANGCVGYVPTRHAFENGGYETRLARSSKLAPEAGEQLVNTALKLLKRLSAEG